MPAMAKDDANTRAVTAEPRDQIDAVVKRIMTMSAAMDDDPEYVIMLINQELERRGSTARLAGKLRR
jgi:hypothetical protein